jgi:hypothetical protein
MAIRRGMADYQQAGAGGIIFVGLLQSITIPMSYEQRRITYRGIYSAILSKLEIDPIFKDDKEISMIVGATKILLDQAGKDYRASFEGKSFDDMENKYCELLAQIYDQLWVLASKGKLIERVQMVQDEVG